MKASALRTWRSTCSSGETLAALRVLMRATLTGRMAKEKPTPRGLPDYFKWPDAKAKESRRRVIDEHNRRASADPGDMSEAKRAERELNPPFVSSLLRLGELEDAAEAAEVAFNDALRTIPIAAARLATMPGENHEFMLAALRELVKREQAAKRALVAHTIRHFELVRRYHRVLGAAKARDAKKAKRLRAIENDGA